MGAGHAHLIAWRLIRRQALELMEVQFLITLSSARMAPPAWRCGVVVAHPCGTSAA